MKRETAEERKALPLASGVLDYFPEALLAVAEVSRVGNEQHHPGQPLHWDKSKSTDEADALMRHLLDRGKRDTDGMRHSAKVAWRALALLQRELDAEAFAEQEANLKATLCGDSRKWACICTGIAPDCLAEKHVGEQVSNPNGIAPQKVRWYPAICKRRCSPFECGVGHGAVKGTRHNECRHHSG